VTSSKPRNREPRTASALITADTYSIRFNRISFRSITFSVKPKPRFVSSLLNFVWVRTITLGPVAYITTIFIARGLRRAGIWGLAGRNTKQRSSYLECSSLSAHARVAMEVIGAAFYFKLILDLIGFQGKKKKKETRNHLKMSSLICTPATKL